MFKSILREVRDILNQLVRGDYGWRTPANAIKQIASYAKYRNAKRVEKQEYTVEEFLEEVQKLSYEQLGVVVECFLKAAIEENDSNFLVGASMLAKYRGKKFPKESEQTQAQAQAGHDSDLIDKFIVARV